MFEPQSPEFQNALMGDADHFMQLPFRVMASQENIIFGSALPGEGERKDGVKQENRNKN